MKKFILRWTLIVTASIIGGILNAVFNNYGLEGYPYILGIVVGYAMCMIAVFIK